MAERVQASSPGRGEETIVADLHEVFGQDMLQEAMDELMSSEGAMFFRTGLGVAITKGHTVILELEETVVAEGNTKDVRRQVLQGIETGTHRFTVDNPVLLPDRGWDTGITICFT